MKNILVVDSHQEYARDLTAHLVEEGYQVTAAFSYAKAIEKIQLTIFSLIFSDLEMAQINAMEFLEYIKRLYPEIPVIVISGHDSRELAVEAARRGAYDFLVKGCFLEEIRFVVRKRLKRRRLGIKNKELFIVNNSLFRLKNFSPDNSRQKYVLVKFFDTGGGIFLKIQKKIFEHFYTTKESGTGLGLAAANQTIQAHNGYIEV